MAIMKKLERTFVTADMLRVLRTMSSAEEAEEWEDAELVSVGGRKWWLGFETVSRRVVERLIQCRAISDRSEERGMQRFGINGTGRAIIEDPSVAEAVMAAMLTGGSFDDRGRPLATP